MCRSDDYFATNDQELAVLDFEMFAEQLGLISRDPYRWKWVIISLHSGLQGLMVGVLKGSDKLGVYPDKYKGLITLSDICLAQPCAATPKTPSRLFQDSRFREYRKHTLHKVYIFRFRGQNSRLRPGPLLKSCGIIIAP